MDWDRKKDILGVSRTKEEKPRMNLDASVGSQKQRKGRRVARRKYQENLGEDTEMRKRKRKKKRKRNTGKSPTYIETTTEAKV